MTNSGSLENFDIPQLKVFLELVWTLKQASSGIHLVNVKDMEVVPSLETAVKERLPASTTIRVLVRDPSSPTLEEATFERSSVSDRLVLFQTIDPSAPKAGALLELLNLHREWLRDQGVHTLLWLPGNDAYALVSRLAPDLWVFRRRLYSLDERPDERRNLPYRRWFEDEFGKALLEHPEPPPWLSPDVAWSLARRTLETLGLQPLWERLGLWRGEEPDPGRLLPLAAWMRGVNSEPPDIPAPWLAMIRATFEEYVSTKGRVRDDSPDAIPHHPPGTTLNRSPGTTRSSVEDVPSILEVLPEFPLAPSGIKSGASAIDSMRKTLTDEKLVALEATDETPASALPLNYGLVYADQYEARVYLDCSRGLDRAVREWLFSAGKHMADFGSDLEAAERLANSLGARTTLLVLDNSRRSTDVALCRRALPDAHIVVVPDVGGEALERPSVPWHLPVLTSKSSLPAPPATSVLTSESSPPGHELCSPDQHIVDQVGEPLPPAETGTKLTPQSRKQLRELLGKLIRSPVTIEMIVEPARIELHRIDFTGSAESIWKRVLEEAERAGCLEGLFEEVKRRYPLSPEWAEIERVAMSAGIRVGSFAARSRPGGAAVGSRIDSPPLHDFDHPEPPAPAAPASWSLRRLLPAVQDFTGRKKELARLEKAITKSCSPGSAGRPQGVAQGSSARTLSPLFIVGLKGQGGLGKTELARALAQSLTPHFPGPHLEINLKGASPPSMAPRDALLLLSGADPRAFPDEEDLSGLRRAYLGTLEGHQGILLLDDAADASQVEPLIPPEGWLLLVTSRRRFYVPGTEVQIKELGTLPRQEARALLARICPRLMDQQTAADRLAARCGYLPLALRVAGKALQHWRDMGVDEYLDALAEQPVGFHEVDALFGQTLARIEPRQSARWVQLGVFPGDFDAAGALAVWGQAQWGQVRQPQKVREARQDLSTLVEVSLVELESGEGESARYRLHDLARESALLRLGKAGPQEVGIEEAGRRHATYYLEVLRRANLRYTDGFEGVQEGLARFDLEWGNIRAGQAWAAARATSDTDAARMCSDYSDAGQYCLDLRVPPRQRIQWLEAALHATRARRDRAGEGAHLGNLGIVYEDMGEPRRAIEYLERAIAIVQEEGDRRSEGNALNNLGLAHADLGEFREAIGCFEQYLAIVRDLGDRRGVGMALGNLGLACMDLGEPRKAIEHSDRALAIAREEGDRRGEGIALANLGKAYEEMEEHGKAIKHFDQALAIAQEVGDRKGEGMALGNLGTAYYSRGEARKAIGYFEQHRVIAREMEDRKGEGYALGNLGLAYADLGEPRKAIEYYKRDLAIAREVGDNRGEGNSLWNWALALYMLRDLAGAISLAEQSLVLLEATESPHADMVRKKLAEWKEEQASRSEKNEDQSEKGTA